MHPDPLTTFGVSHAAAQAWPDGPASEDGGAALTFAQLHEAGRRAARAFLAAGVGHGDRIAILAPNRLDWQVAAMGLQFVGAALVPVNTRFKRDEVVYVLRSSGACLLLTVDDFLGVDYAAMVVGQDLPDLRATIRFDGQGAGSWSAFLEAGEAVDEARLSAAASGVSAGDVADIMFTSGTTGRPKGVVSTHGQNVQTVRAWVEVVGLGPADRYLIINPYFHAFGYKAGWMAAMIAGATALPVPVFDPATIADRVRAQEISALPGPPTIFQTLLAASAAGQARFDKLRLALVGSATVPQALVEAMREDLGFSSILIGYGLTETAGITTMCRAGVPEDQTGDTCGPPLPGVELVIADDEGRVLPQGESGEVLVRGFNVMKGYFNDPAATAEAIDADGWLHTGDIGQLTPSGTLKITDRKKDLYISGGFNCYPAEIERMLCEHPDVAIAAVIGVPDERLGEVGHAFIVPRSGASLTPEGVIAWSRERMANFKMPRRVDIVSALPMTASGKVQKFDLQTLARPQSNP